MGLSAFDRHQQLMTDAIKYYRAKIPPEQQTVKTDFDVLREQYRYVVFAKHAMWYALNDQHRNNGTGMTGSLRPSQMQSQSLLVLSVAALLL